MSLEEIERGIGELMALYREAADEGTPEALRQCLRRVRPRLQELARRAKTSEERYYLARSAEMFAQLDVDLNPSSRKRLESKSR